MSFSLATDKYFKENCMIPSGSHVICVKNEISKESDTKSFTIQSNRNSTKDIYDSIFEMLSIEISKVPIIFNEDKKKTHAIILTPKNGGRSMRFMVSYSQANSIDIARLICKFLCKGECKF